MSDPFDQDFYEARNEASYEEFMSTQPLQPPRRKTLAGSGILLQVTEEQVLELEETLSILTPNGWVAPPAIEIMKTAIKEQP